MQIAIIKQLAETYNITTLRTAEDAILNGQPLPITVEGKDEGEQLTHILATIEILHDMEKHELDFRTALRNYTQRVRNSIS